MKAGSSHRPEKIEKVLPGEALSVNQLYYLDKQEVVRSKDYTPGKYLFLPMSHFCVPVKYQGVDCKSKRVLAFKLTDDSKKIEYIRTWKVTNFSGMIIPFGSEDMNILMDISAITNEEGLRRIPSGLINYVHSCSDEIPSSITSDKMFHIDRPFIIDFQGTIRGMKAEYKEEFPGSNRYNVVEEDGHVLFCQTSIVQFNVLTYDVDEELINAAKDVLAKDEQLSSITLDC